MKNLIDLCHTKNYYELYNCFAIWITENPEKHRTGKIYKDPTKGVRQYPISDADKTYGFRSFLKTFIDDPKQIKYVESACSELLGSKPELFEKKADIFAKTFPRLIEIKKENKRKRANVEQKKTDSKLTEFFEQKSLEFKPEIEDLQLSDIATTMIALADKGAKTIKTPDGWEVQF